MEKRYCDGPLVDNVFIIYVNSKRLQDVIELESLKIINNIEKKLGFSVNSLLVQLQNNQQKERISTKIRVQQGAVLN